MPQKISNYIFSALLLISACAAAQTKAVVKKDTVRNPFLPTGIRIGTDAISLVRNFTDNKFKGWEINADADFRNYYLALEIGNTQRQMILSNGHYSNNGNYWRVGVDINLLKKDIEKNMLFFGIRFGHSQYDEQLNYTITNEFGTVESTLYNKNLKGNWLEGTTGLRVRVFKSFWMGYTGRIKFAANYSNQQQLQTYDIPGYGLTFKKPWWGFNYYLMFRIPITKKV